MTLPSRLSVALDRFEEALIAIALAVMTLLTFIQVILRYFFQASLVWSLEATTFIFGWLIVIGMAYGVRTRAHIAVDLLVRKLPQALQGSIAMIAFVISLAYCGLMLIGSVNYVRGLIRLGHMAQDIAVPRWVLAAVLPLGFALLALRLLQAGWRHFSPSVAAQESHAE